MIQYYFGYRPKKVSIHGTEYRVGTVVSTGFSDDQLPEFASISKIVVTPQNKIIFLLKKFVSIAFISHYHAFEVRREIHPQNCFAFQNDFLTYLPSHTICPFGAASRNGACYIAPRYSVPNYTIVQCCLIILLYLVYL